jgi:hypothetical protein
MPEPWRRIKNKESSKAYEAFCVYRDLGVTRSLNQVVHKCGKSRSLLDRWSSKYRWVERAAAYDEYLEEERRKRHKGQIEQITDQVTDIAVASLERLGKKMQTDNPGPYAATERLTAVVNAVWKTHGLDKKQVELSGEIKTNSDKALHLIEAINATVTPEQRMELSKKLMDIAEGSNDKESEQ